MAIPSEAPARVEFVLIVVLLILSWLTVYMRLWVRFWLTKSQGWDDALIILSLCLFTCYCSFILVLVLRGSFSHVPTKKSIGQTLTYIQLSEIFYVLTTTTLKLALGLFFLRVVSKKWQKNIFYVILGVSAVYGIIYAFIVIFQCGRPSQELTNIIQGKCLSNNVLLGTGYLYGIVNVLADWTFVLIPIAVLMDSELDRKSKISVSIIMALGAVGSVSSIARMFFLKGLLFSGGYLEDTAKATVWATAEPGTGIIAASLATLRPLFRKITLQVRASTNSKGSRFSRGKSSSSRSTQPKNRNNPLGEFDNESTVVLTSISATASRGSTCSTGKPLPAKPGKISFDSARSEVGDPWSPGIRVEQGRIAKVVNVRIVSEEGQSRQ